MSKQQEHAKVVHPDLFEEPHPSKRAGGRKTGKKPVFGPPGGGGFLVNPPSGRRRREHSDAVERPLMKTRMRTGVGAPGRAFREPGASLGPKPTGAGPKL